MARQTGCSADLSDAHHDLDSDRLPAGHLRSGLQRVDPELYEAASPDGANWWQRFLAITLPAIKPEIFVVALTLHHCRTQSVRTRLQHADQRRPGNQHHRAVVLLTCSFFQSQQVGYGAAIATVLTVVIIVAVMF